MFQVDISKLTPKFILDDKNGYAVAKALEAGLQMMNGIIRQGLSCLSDYDTMPEWRLDELAWEMNCLYDYSESIETKRKWIKNAVPWYRLLGTPGAVLRHASGYLDNVVLEENWEYGGEPYHFRLRMEIPDGGITGEQQNNAFKGIGYCKNVRSVLDPIDYYTDSSGQAVTGAYTESSRKVEVWPELAGTIEMAAEAGTGGTVVLDKRTEVFP